MGAVIAGDRIASVFGDQFFDDEPWEHFNPKGLMKWAWIEDMLGVPFEKFHKWLSGFDEKLATRWRLEFIGDNPLPPEDQTEHPRNPSGLNQHKKEDRSVDNINRPKGGTDTTYTLRRLARDAPELLDKIEAGEMNVNQAAIAAGIRKKPSNAEKAVAAFRKSENRLEPLKLMVGLLEPYELAVLRDWCIERLD
jgi:hypothetical protein